MQLILAILGTCSCHMLMKFPLSRGYKENSHYRPIDYDLSSPQKSGAMCKGKAPGTPTLVLTAGQTIDVQFEGSARHGGGVCQFSLSYDNDKTFYVIEEYQGSCPDSRYAWPVTIPKTVPPCDRCTFAWTWVNAIGNREFYMDCADVQIMRGPLSKSRIDGAQIDVFNLEGHPTSQPKPADGAPASNIVTRPLGE